MMRLFEVMSFYEEEIQTTKAVNSIATHCASELGMAVYAATDTAWSGT